MTAVLEHFVIEIIYTAKCSGLVKRSATRPARLEQAGFARRGRQSQAQNAIEQIDIENVHLWNSNKGASIWI
jgi:hypothetical protein